MTEGVGIGTAIVSYIEPYEGAARDFNRWYERDHFPAAVMAGPGVYAGARWVATRECKDLRPDGELFGEPELGSYLATAWVLPDAQPEWDAWVEGQMEKLRDEDRMFEFREHVQTAVYEYGWEARAVDAPAAFIALDRGYPGLIAIAIEVDEEADDSDIETWSRALVDPELPVVVAFRRQRLLVSELDDEPAFHVLVLAFVDGDAIDVWERIIDPALEERDDIGFASPFFATVAGTDVFVDEL